MVGSATTLCTTATGLSSIIELTIARCIAAGIIAIIGGIMDGTGPIAIGDTMAGTAITGGIMDGTAITGGIMDGTAITGGITDGIGITGGTMVGGITTSTMHGSTTKHARTTLSD
jgi:hypothetical protein